VDDLEFLRAFGGRLRGERMRRGWTRRQLAENAGISERYITQIESGKGNVSLLVLRQIAAALALPLTELLDATNIDRSSRVALIGLRGAGKTTIGTAVAAKLDVPFFELDREIERLSGTSLGPLIELYGQEAYRRYELQALQNLLDSHPTFVVATGGGIVSEPETYDTLLRNCFTVWLRATPEEHMARVIAQGDHRPMAGSARAMDDLRRILEERTPLYQRADATLNTSRTTEKKVVKTLLSLLDGTEL
jgi:XRE family transcriptional regulator, aerobic/anaerobic benzoate catabolism transcriptional regulator